MGNRPLTASMGGRGSGRAAVRPRRTDSVLRKVSMLVAIALASSLAVGETWEWPQFHGPMRDNKSEETGLLKQWPEGGPTLVWTAKGIGKGFSSVAVAGGLLYTTGNIEKDTVITALDPGGKTVWTAKNGPACRHQYPGARGTPTIDGTRLYHENADGDAVCLEAKTGKKVWGLNILKTFGGRNIKWGLAESVLVDGDRVICTPGGEKVSMVALDKKTGKTVWTCEGADDTPGYCSPLLVEQKGRRMIVTLMGRSFVGVDAGTGRLLWKVRHKTMFDENISMPIYHDGHLFVSTFATGARCFKLTVEGYSASVKEVWRTRKMDNQHGGVLLVDGHLYGCCRTRLLAGPWVCLDFKTGKEMLETKGVGRVSPTCADGMIYALSHRREVALVRPNPKAFDLVSRFTVPKGGRGPTWAHPVVCAGRLYVRHDDFLYCYDVKRK